MSYRRMLYLGQFAAAVVLPIWVLISRGILDDGVGWQLLVYLVACPVLSIVMIAVGALINARLSVRTSRAVTWLDAGLLTAWYVIIFAYGLWAWPVLAVAVVLVGVALFWVSAWRLFTETRTRFRGLVAGMEQAAQPPRGPASSTEPRRIIVINPDDVDPKH